jgi:hypothetical protein
MEVLAVRQELKWYLSLFKLVQALAAKCPNRKDRESFVADFNNASLDEQLRLMDQEPGEKDVLGRNVYEDTLRLSEEAVPGNVALLGCNQYSSSYVFTRRPEKVTTKLFVVGEKRIYFLLELHDYPHPQEDGTEDNQELHLTPFISVEGGKYFRIKEHPSNIAPRKTIKSKKGDVALNYGSHYEGLFRFNGFQLQPESQTKAPYLNLRPPTDHFAEELKLLGCVSSRAS